MSIEKFFPTSPDLNIREESDMTLAKFGHLNTLIDKLNSMFILTPTAFNPLFTDASGTLAGVTATASYTMIAPKICFFRVHVDFSGCTNFGTLGYQITLPFPSVETMRQANGTLHQPALSAQYHIAGITDTDTANASILILYYSGSTTDLAWKFNTPVGATTVTSHFDISGVYEIV
jgi:hypothetical protein